MPVWWGWLPASSQIANTTQFLTDVHQPAPAAGVCCGLVLRPHVGSCGYKEQEISMTLPVQNPVTVAQGDGVITCVELTTS
jgi:hypothetical protein